MEVVSELLHFKRPAGTSRGVYTDRKVWYIRLSSPQHPKCVGVGECAPLPALSCDDVPEYESILSQVSRRVNECNVSDLFSFLADFPSITFGLDTAIRHYYAGSYAFYSNPFSEGEEGIPINGLIWMGRKEDMYAQIKAKLEIGFGCLKLKIGAIDFDEELELLRLIRKQFGRDDITLRVDANGAFSPAEVMTKLERLSVYDIHSIEQPIRARQWEVMSKVIAETPIPIALDEELIGINSRDGKRELLDALHPHYIIIKPSLHGGPDDWVELAAERGIPWWGTSALESNIGLNAIAQWVGNYDPQLPQGLGTGLLFVHNKSVPLQLRGDRLWYTP
ncbi:MAG: o-succinylbenzoate synthase [Porphyromonas sp.]|nr:o-succinylbenzoate synthase [Porphyromonas sp.]